ncbi:MAG: hypothetical protein JWL61_3524 [Gemmatimonadetes bacterium]|nr:hypothetical protein [Gemmatimonadota bacterium]
MRAHLAALSLLATFALPSSASAQDSSFAAMQKRGKVAMGVDQYTSIHKFDDLADGGRIELQRDRDDVVGTRAIREHLKAISAAFSQGDFSTPAFVHMRDVPGTKVMAARRGVIRYEFRELPRGGELRITTGDSVARIAVHQFLAFQRSDHNAAGHEMHKP